MKPWFFLELDHMTRQDRHFLSALTAAQVSFRVSVLFQAHVEPKLASGLQGFHLR